MIAIIDYGAGNLSSVSNALSYLSCESMISNCPEEIMSADGVILPGVGAFGDAMQEIRARRLDVCIRKFIETGKPFLGICLGMQVLFEGSEESPGVAGLNLLKGKICRIPQSKGLKIPHMGWNELRLAKQGALFNGLKKEDADGYCYFVHSYYLKAEEDIVTATVEYGVSMDVAIQKYNLHACQFHPEKSGAYGLSMLMNFIKLMPSSFMPSSLPVQ